MSKSRTVVKVKKLDDIGLSILDKLKGGENTDKEIANQFNVDLAVIKMIKKYHMKPQEENSLPALEVNSISSISDNMPYASNKENDKSVKKEDKVTTNSHYRQLTDDVRIEILSCIENGLSARETSKKLNVSMYACYNTAKMFEVKFQNNQNNNISSKNKSIESEVTNSVDKEEDISNKDEINTSNNDVGIFNESDFTFVSKDNFVRIGVLQGDCCDDRVSNFIFGDSFGENEKWNFMNQRNYALDKIHSFVDREGTKFTEKVILHLSKIESYNLSVIMTLLSINVNASVSLFDDRTGEEYLYPINDKVKNVNDNLKSHIRYQLNMSDKCYIYKAKNSKDINEHFYTINIIENLGSNKEFKSSYIFNDILDSWKYFSIFVNKYINDRTIKTAVFLDECFDTCSKGNSSKNLSKFYNN